MARCHAAVNIVQEKVCRHGGTLTRVLTDDKGTRFLVAFGLPGRAHEDDEARAVIASLEIAEALAHVPGGDAGDGVAPLGCAIGITTGKVFCCEAGSPLRREYTLNGSHVNLAARLMQAASKYSIPVLVDRATQQGAELHACACEVDKTLEPISVKGRVEPVTIFAPRLPTPGGPRRGISASMKIQKASMAALSPDTRKRPTGPAAVSAKEQLGGAKSPRLADSGSDGVVERTLGRQAEIDALRDALRSLEEGACTAHVLVGESGMGKTHMVSVLRALHAQASGGAPSQVGLLLNSSRPIESTAPFFLWRAIFDRLFTDDALRTLALRATEHAHRSILQIGRAHV